jgi:hypothetical protein
MEQLATLQTQVNYLTIAVFVQLLMIIALLVCVIINAKSIRNVAEASTTNSNTIKSLVDSVGRLSGIKK